MRKFARKIVIIIIFIFSSTFLGLGLNGDGSKIIWDMQESHAEGGIPAPTPRPFLNPTQYSLLEEILDTHLNYFLSNDAITSSGFPLGAYKEGDRGRYNYSNPTEWGYALLAWIIAADRGIITEADAASKIENALDTMIILQNDPNQNYQKLFYPYYYVATRSGTDLATPYHDANHWIPSIDNGFLYTSLLITEGWAKRNGLTTVENKAHSISSQMNFRMFLKPGGEYLAHLIRATTGQLSSSHWDIYADEGGVMAWIAYVSDSVTSDEYRTIIDAMMRPVRTWNSITVNEAAWFNAMFAWGVRSLAGFPVATWETGIQNLYSSESFANTVEAHMAYGDWLGAYYPAFSDAMTQAGCTAHYTPPNIPNEVPTTIPAHVVPHAFFIPFCIGPDLETDVLTTLFAKISDLKTDAAGYYHDGGDGHKPFGFEVTASPAKDDVGYTPPESRYIYETLGHAYTLISIYQGLNIHDGNPTLLYYACEVPGYFEKVEDVLNYLYPGTGWPGVSDIPDQIIRQGESFAAINLDDYVSDPDHTDEELTWAYSGNTDLTVSIVDRIATVTAPTSEWTGSETITFKATDPGGLYSSDSATFIVTTTISWEESYISVGSGETVTEIAALNSLLFVRTWNASGNCGIYKSSDLGTNWQPINISLPTGSALYAMDVDQGKLYVACRNGIVMSDDEGANFNWSFTWGWDACLDVDMQNGHGWAAIKNWGSKSGPIRKTPESSWTSRRGDIPWAYMSMAGATADPIDPYNIAYVDSTVGPSYRTLDSGEHWLAFYGKIIYATIIGGESVIYMQNYNDEGFYSRDHGDTWQLLGMTVHTIIRDEQTGLFFAAGTTGGIYVGYPGHWEPCGLSNQTIQSLTICGRRLFAVSTTGRIFRTVIPDSPRVLNVPSEDYPTIEDAITAAVSEDTINIAAGTYTEDIIMKPGVDLVGESAENTIIEGNILCLEADDTIENLTIIYDEGEYATFTNSHYTDWQILTDAGITAVDSEITVRNCIIYPYITGPFGKGIQIWNLYGSDDIDPLIEDVEISYADTGIYLSSQPFGGAIGGDIRDSVLSNNTYGIVERMHKENPVISGNLISDSTDGIHITYEDGELLDERLSNITGNTFQDNTNDIWCAETMSGY